MREAASRYGVEPAQVRMWENGDRTPSEERQAVLLAALSVPVASPDMAEYQRGALWALAAMHETLGRLYRDLSQVVPAIATPIGPDPREEIERVADAYMAGAGVQAAPRPRRRKAK